MAGVPAVPSLTLYEQACEARRLTHVALDFNWNKREKVRAANSAALYAIELDEWRAYKRVQRHLGEWKRERRRCKKGGLNKARKRLDSAIRDWRPLNAKRGRLISEIVRASEKHEFVRWSLYQAKEAERMAGILYDNDETRTPFFGSSQEIEALYEQITEDKFRLVEKAGVPETYREDVHVTRDKIGNTHFYFGGIDRPDGLDHGHHVMNTAGVVFYHRNPVSLDGFHGGHNYIPEYQIAHASVI